MLGKTHLGWLFGCAPVCVPVDTAGANTQRKLKGWAYLMKRLEVFGALLKDKEEQMERPQTGERGKIQSNVCEEHNGQRKFSRGDVG